MSSPKKMMCESLCTALSSSQDTSSHAHGFNPKRFFIISSIVPLLIGRSLLPDIFIGAIWLGPDAGIVFEGGSDAGCGVVFDAGCGVVFDAGCGVVFDAGCGVVFDAGCGVVFDAGCGVVFDAGCGVVFDAGCGVVFDAGCGVVFDAGSEPGKESL